MKKIYVPLKAFLFAFTIFSLAQNAKSQCAVDYTTQNYFCDLDSLLLSAVPLEGTAPFSFIWETGETTQTIMIPLALGDYMLTMTDATGCTHIINCHIKPYPDVLYYPFAQSACDGDIVTVFLEWFRDSIPGATYLWSTGETTPTITITESTLWSVTVTDPSNGCEFVIPEGLFEFHETNQPQIVGPEMICGGQSVTLTVEGGPFGSIVWYPPGEPNGIWAPTLTIDAPGEYIVWASSPTAGYCWKQDTINISVGTIVPPILNGPPALCNGQTGTISITNHPFYESFLWNNGETSYSFTVTSPGQYTVTVTSEGGCTATGNIVVGNANENVLTADPTAAFCGLGNGSITISYSISGSYDFLWSNGATTQNLVNVPAGTYSVTATADNGCTATTTATIPEIEIPIELNENIIHNTSCDEVNGSIELLIVPSGNYNIIWSNGETTEDLENLAPGTYAVTVTTGITCSASESYYIDDLSAAPNIQTTALPEQCGNGDGSIDLQISEGTPPFSFAWSNGQTTQNISNLGSGIYTVTVGAADGCSTILSTEITNQSAPVIINGVVTPNTSCSSSNGSIDISLPIPANYIFNWSNGAQSEDLSDLAEGTYTVTVSLGPTCQQTETFIVTNENLPFQITGSIQNNSSCHAANGAIDITVDPAGSYSFIWSHGEVTEDLTGLQGGSYAITVTNNEECSISATFTVYDTISDIELTGTVLPNTSCLAANGSVDITVSTPGIYTFEWSDGTTSEDLQAQSAGNYIVTVTDASGCYSTASFSIEDQINLFSLTASVTDNQSCANPNGSIDLTVEPPGTYNFAWSDNSASEDIVNLGGGIYHVTVSDINGCTLTDTFNIININSSFSLSATPTHNTSCTVANGSIDLTITPADIYTFSWSTGETSEDIHNLSQGIYQVTVSDQAGCSSTLSVSVQDDREDPIITGLTENTFCGQDNGAISLTVLPATGNSFAWSNGSMDKDLEGISAGSYSVTVTSANGCTASVTFDITNEQTTFTVSGNSIPQTSCNAANGSIDITVNPPGDYTFLWSNGSPLEDISNIPAGNYDITVTDDAGCQHSLSFTVAENLIMPLISMNISPATCGQSNGAIDLTIDLTTGNTCLWSNGSTKEDLHDILPGNYQVTVTSSMGCTAEASIEVPNEVSNFDVQSSIQDDASCMTANGLIDLTISPAGNYAFLWSNGMTSEDLIQIPSGVYQVTVTDEFNCATSQSFIIENIASIPIVYDVITSTSCGLQNGYIDLTVEDSGPVMFLWSTGDTSEDLTQVQPGTYHVTVTNEQGCISTAEFIVPGSNPVLVELDTDLSSFATNGTVICNLELSIPDSFISIINWMPLDLLSCQEPVCMEQIFWITEPTQISVLVTDLNGCTGSANLFLDIDKEYRVYIPNVFTPNGDGANDIFTVYANEEIEEVAILQIFNRWGDMLFENEHFPPNETLYGWDGIYYGQMMNPDVFAFRAVVLYKNGEAHTFKGDVTLVR